MIWRISFLGSFRNRTADCVNTNTGEDIFASLREANTTENSEVDNNTELNGAQNENANNTEEQNGSTTEDAETNSSVNANVSNVQD